MEQKQWDGHERRAGLTGDRMEALAERAAEKALAKVYAEVGRSVIKKVFWIVGAVAVGLLMYLSGKGVPLQ